MADRIYVWREQEAQAQAESDVWASREHKLQMERQILSNEVEALKRQLEVTRADAERDRERLEQALGAAQSLMEDNDRIGAELQASRTPGGVLGLRLRCPCLSSPASDYSHAHPAAA